MGIAFDLKEAITFLERTPEIVKAQLWGLPDVWLQNNEGGNSWSPNQIVGHLVYGEEADWLMRTKIILAFGTKKEFEPYDRFAQDRLYSDKSIEELLSLFKERRAKNLEELKSFNLAEKDLNKKGLHPEFGEISLKTMLSAWVVHDQGHIAQIARVLAKNYTEEIGPWTKYLTIVRSKPPPEK